MPAKNKTTLHRDVTCPFCSLLCDDLSVKSSSGVLSVSTKGCAQAIKLFERKELNVTPCIRGEEVPLEDAIEHAASILNKARQPLFAGSSTDVAGNRSLVELAERSRGTLDHVYGDAMMCNIQVLQSKGWIMTTLAEVKNRADFILFVGTDASSKYPRFFERFVWDTPSLAGLKKNARELFYIGENLDISAGKNPAGAKAAHLKCSNKEINEMLAVLRSVISGANIETSAIESRKLSWLRKLADKIKAGQYGVIVWDPSEFSADTGDITIYLITELLRSLNKNQRFAGLSLGGNEGGNSFMSVSTWQTGFPLRVSFNQGAPAFDPYAFSTKNMLREKTADAMLWLSNFNASLPMPRTDIPTIALSRSSKRLSQEAEVYIPIATPGLDHSGNLMRTDSVVSMPLKQLRDSHLQSASEILSWISKALSAL